MLQEASETHEDNLGSICVQVGVVDMLKLLELHPAAVFGDSFGKLTTTYYYGISSLDETILTAIKISQLDFDSDLHFKADFAKLQTQDKKRSDVLSSQDLVDTHKKHFVLNVSDAHLNCKDELLVEDRVVNFLSVLGRYVCIS